MSDYNPDKWVVLEVFYENGEVENRILASWYGGYAGSDSWKLGTGIQSHEHRGPVYSFTGSSGSTYYCHESDYGMSSYAMSILASLGDKARLLTEEEVKVLYV
jgi:hypothetical protein